MPVPASLRALLERSIDYAGMFPPCSLKLEPALEKHASYVRAPESWLLNTFVLPVGKFQETAAHLSRFDRTYPLRISALGEKSDSADAFSSRLTETLQSVETFSAQHVDLASINQLEISLPPADERLTAIQWLGKQEVINGNRPIFWEASADAAETTIAELAGCNAQRSGSAFGFKLRTGGVTADAFPTSSQIATALVAAIRHRVPIKFTAGLHHPIRQFRDEVKTKMHGFLNVLGAGVLAAANGWNEKQASEMLDDEDAEAFSFIDDSLQWRDWRVSSQEIRKQRRLITSFGSCSVDEPREDLRALNLL